MVATRGQTLDGGPVTSTPKMLQHLWDIPPLWHQFRRLDRREGVETMQPPLIQLLVQLEERRPPRREPVLDLHRWDPDHCQDAHS